MPVLDRSEVERPHRAVWPAVKNGMISRCPNCAEGKMFRAYLKVADTCDVCGEELHHHRADDAPPYLVIFILGHILIGVVLKLEMMMTIPASVYLWTMIPLTIVLSLLMLPPTKGAVVALQWAKYMHGFDPAGPQDENTEFETR